MDRSILQMEQEAGMERRAKVELFEQIRREYEFGLGSIKGIAAKFGVHRRMVRQALLSAEPPERKPVERVRPVMGPLITGRNENHRVLNIGRKVLSNSVARLYKSHHFLAFALSDAHFHPDRNGRYLRSIV